MIGVHFENVEQIAALTVGILASPIFLRLLLIRQDKRYSKPRYHRGECEKFGLVL